MSEHPWMLYAVGVVFFVLFLMGRFIEWRAPRDQTGATNELC